MPYHKSILGGKIKLKDLLQKGEFVMDAMQKTGISATKDVKRLLTARFGDYNFFEFLEEIINSKKPKKLNLANFSWFLPAGISIVLTLLFKDAFMALIIGCSCAVSFLIMILLGRLLARGTKRDKILYNIISGLSSYLDRGRFVVGIIGNFFSYFVIFFFLVPLLLWFFHEKVLWWSNLWIISCSALIFSFNFALSEWFLGRAVYKKIEEKLK